MTFAVPMHDESLMPIRLGSPLRCPAEDWGKYGIKWDTDPEYDDLVFLGRRQYALEYASGDPSQHKIIGEASKRAFGGIDNNQLLREATGKIAASYIKTRKPGKYLVVDLGAGDGQSAEQFVKSLPKGLNGEVEMLLLDPNPNALEIAESKIKGYGIGCEKAVCTQDQLPGHLKGREVNMIIQVGAIHHDPDIPFQTFYKSLKNGGLFVSGDWHPQTWQNPAYVYRMLQQMKWPKKEEGLSNYKLTYGVDENTPLPADPKDAKAIQDIFNFWKEYQGMLAEAGNFGKNSIWPHESHQDYRRYADKMSRAGFVMQDDGELAEIRQDSGFPNSPHLFYPDSSIIAGISGIKRV
jgi:SAM-dependent methyltransferase